MADAPNTADAHAMLVAEYAVKAAKTRYRTSDPQSSGEHIRSTDPSRNSRVEERIAEAARHRLAGAQLAFLAKIARDRLGYANRHNESNAEMIGRLLNDYADRHPLVGVTR